MAKIPDCIARDIAMWLRRGIAYPGVKILEQWADILEDGCEEEDPLIEYQNHQSDDLLLVSQVETN